MDNQPSCKTRRAVNGIEPSPDLTITPPVIISSQPSSQQQCKDPKESRATRTEIPPNNGGLITKHRTSLLQTGTCDKTSRDPRVSRIERHSCEAKTNKEAPGASSLPHSTVYTSTSAATPGTIFGQIPGAKLPILKGILEKVFALPKENSYTFQMNGVKFLVNNKESQKICVMKEVPRASDCGSQVKGSIEPPQVEKGEYGSRKIDTKELESGLKCTQIDLLVIMEVINMVSFILRNMYGTLDFPYIRIMRVPKFP